MVKKKGEATGPEGKAGFSEFTWPDGAKYAGEWQDGKMHGKGTYVETDGARYEGEWDNGKMHGQGVQIFAKGDRYEGEYFNGQRHGKGKQAFANGNMYEGHFWQSQIHGKGTYTCADGRVYWGEFKNNKKHGDGKYSGANGTYTGQYAEGKKHGNGQFTWLDGSSYDGQWADDVMHGTGMKTEADGSRHQVVFEKGRQVNSLATLSSTMRAPGKSALPVPSPSTRESSTARKLGGAKQGPFRDDGMAGSWKQAGTRPETDDDMLPLETEDEGMWGLQKNWNELSSALNCYGADTGARKSKKERGTCAPSRLCNPGQLF